MIMGNVKIIVLVLIVITGACFVSRVAFAEAGNSELKACYELIMGNHIDEAKQRLNIYRRSHPDDPIAIFHLARIEDDYYKALALLKEVEILAIRSVTAAPDSNLAGEAVYARAEMEFSAGRITIARDLYERVSMMYPTCERLPDTLYRIGMCELNGGSPREALATFRKYLESEPEGTFRSLAATARMECYVALGQWQEALSAAHMVLEEEDEQGTVTPRVLEVISLAWKELGNEHNANQFTDRLLKYYPDSYQALAIKENSHRILIESNVSFDNPTASPDSTSGATPAAQISAVEIGNADSSAGNGQAFSIQAGAFQNKDNALGMYVNIRDADFDVRVDMVSVNGANIYKVLIGRYASREEAERIAKRITASTGIKTIVVILE